MYFPRRNPLTAADIKAKIAAMKATASPELRGAVDAPGPISSPNNKTIVQNFWDMLDGVRDNSIDLDTLFDGTTISPLKETTKTADVNRVIRSWGATEAEPFLRLGLTHDRSGNLIPLAARLAMENGLISRGFYSAGALESGQDLDLYQTTADIAALVGISERIIEGRIREENARLAAESVEDDVDDNLRALWSTTKNAWQRLNDIYQSAYNLITSDNQVAYAEMKEKLAAYYENRSRYLIFIDQVVKPRAGAAWSTLYGLMLRFDDKTRRLIGGVFGRGVSSQKARRTVLQEAAKRVLMTTGLPATEIPASNSRNFAIYRAVENEIESQMRTQPRSSGGGIQFLGVRGPKVSAPSATLPTYMAARSPYRMKESLTVPAAWMSAAPFMSEATVLRLSPDLTYLILYRKGARVGAYGTALSGQGGNAELANMLTEVLKNEQIWRNDDRVRARARLPIYIVQAGSTVAYPVFAPGPRSRVTEFEDTAITKIVTSARLQDVEWGQLISFQGITPVEICSPEEAHTEREAFEAQMDKYGLREQFTAAEPDLTEPEGSQDESSQEEDEKSPMVSVTVTPYEDGDEVQYAKIAEVLLGVDPLPIVVVKDTNSKFAGSLRDAANSRGVNVRIQSESGANASGVGRFVFLLHTDPDKDVKTLGEEFLSALQNKASIYKIYDDQDPVPNIILATNSAALSLLSTVDVTRKNAKEKINAEDEFSAALSLLRPFDFLSVTGLAYDTVRGKSLLEITSALLLQALNKRGISSGPIAQFTSRGQSPSANPLRRPLRNDGRRRRIEYVARAFQRVTS